MRRILAILLGTVVIVSSGQGSARHIHVYLDHDHPEHHHGPAVHEHRHRSNSHRDAGVARMEACEPGEHSVSIGIACTAVPHAHMIAADCGEATLFAPLDPAQPTIEVADVRVHGPPPRTQAPPRAPPLTLPA